MDNGNKYSSAFAMAEAGDTELASLRRQIEAANIALVEAFEHGVCVKARYTTRGCRWRNKHAEAIQRALGTIK